MGSLNVGREALHVSIVSATLRLGDDTEVKKNAVTLIIERVSTYIHEN